MDIYLFDIHYIYLLGTGGGSGVEAGDGSGVGTGGGSGVGTGSIGGEAGGGDDSVW